MSAGTPGMEQVFDVIIQGLGGMGSAAAWHCAKRGARVLGLEQFSPAHDRGSSHGEWRVYREAYFEDPSYVPLAVRAGQLWEELAQITGEPLFRRCGVLMVSQPGLPVFDGCLASASLHHLPHQVLNAAQMAEYFPTLRPAEGQLGFFEPRGGAVRVEDSVRAHLKLAESAGATLRFGERVIKTGHEPNDAGIAVTTEAGRYRARKLLACAGAWSGEELKKYGIKFFARRVVQVWFAARPGALPSNSAAPVVFYETPDRVWFYGIPPADPHSPDAVWKFAFHNRHEACDPDTVHRTVDAREIAELRTQIERYLPGLVGETKKSGVCLYEMSADGHFIIGAPPRDPAVIFAAGFSGHGYKFASAVGEVLADLALTGHTALDLSFFSPSRPRM